MREGFSPSSLRRASTAEGPHCGGPSGAQRRLYPALPRGNLLVGADDPPCRVDRIQEERRRAVLKPVVVVVVLDEAGAAARADRTAIALGDCTGDAEVAETGAAAVVVHDERVLQRQDGGIDVQAHAV